MNLRRLSRKFFADQSLPTCQMGVVLSELLSQANIKLLDIGARGGAIYQLELLAPFAHYYACEPEQKETQRIVAELNSRIAWRSTTIIPEAISSKEGILPLYVTKQPGLSSLLKPDPLVVAKFFNNGDFDIELQTSVNAISLEHASERYDFKDLCFIKLDTQGTELDILKSGGALLAESVIGVYVEGLFHPFYAGQSLFSDVDLYLRNLGFSLFDLNRSLTRRSSLRKDLFSKPQILWAHGLYLKEPDTFVEQDDQMTCLFVARLMALALAFEHYDLALELVNFGKSAKVIQNTYGSKIKEDVEAFIQCQTEVYLKRNRLTDLNAPTAPQKDKRYYL